MLFFVGLLFAVFMILFYVCLLYGFLMGVAVYFGVSGTLQVWIFFCAFVK